MTRPPRVSKVRRLWLLFPLVALEGAHQLLVAARDPTPGALGLGRQPAEEPFLALRETCGGPSGPLFACGERATGRRPPQGDKRLLRHGGERSRPLALRVDFASQNTREFRQHHAGRWALGGLLLPPVKGVPVLSTWARLCRSLNRHNRRESNTTTPKASLRSGCFKQRLWTITGSVRNPSCCSVPCCALELVRSSRALWARCPAVGTVVRSTQPPASSSLRPIRAGWGLLVVFSL
jgi:hypothetical protein